MITNSFSPRKSSNPSTSANEVQTTTQLLSHEVPNFFLWFQTSFSTFQTLVSRQTIQNGKSTVDSALWCDVVEISNLSRCLFFCGESSSAIVLWRFGKTQWIDCEWN
jgi:hypothetical protein